MYHIACIASSQCVRNFECTSLLRATPMTTEPAVKTTEARRIVGLRPKRSQNGPATNENNHAAPTLRNNVHEETVILFWTFLSRSSKWLSQHLLGTRICREICDLSHSVFLFSWLSKPDFGVSHTAVGENVYHTSFYLLSAQQISKGRNR